MPFETAPDDMHWQIVGLPNQVLLVKFDKLLEKCSANLLKISKALIVFAGQWDEHCVCPIADCAMGGLVSLVKWPLPRTNNNWLRGIAVFPKNMESIFYLVDELILSDEQDNI